MSENVLKLALRHLSIMMFYAEDALDGYAGEGSYHECRSDLAEAAKFLLDQTGDDGTLDQAARILSWYGKDGSQS